MSKVNRIVGITGIVLSVPSGIIGFFYAVFSLGDLALKNNQVESVSGIAAGLLVPSALLASSIHLTTKS
jgi:hypothetical protein